MHNVHNMHNRCAAAFSLFGVVRGVRGLELDDAPASMLSLWIDDTPDAAAVAPGVGPRGSRPPVQG
jgi:hypothetical protein